MRRDNHGIAHKSNVVAAQHQRGSIAHEDTAGASRRAAIDVRSALPQLQRAKPENDAAPVSASLAGQNCRAWIIYGQAYPCLVCNVQDITGEGEVVTHRTGSDGQDIGARRSTVGDYSRAETEIRQAIDR